MKPRWPVVAGQPPGLAVLWVRVRAAAGARGPRRQVLSPTAQVLCRCLLQEQTGTQLQAVFSNPLCFPLPSAAVRVAEALASRSRASLDASKMLDWHLYKAGSPCLPRSCVLPAREGCGHSTSCVQGSLLCDSDGFLGQVKKDTTEKKKSGLRDLVLMWLDPIVLKCSAQRCWGACPP